MFRRLRDIEILRSGGDVVFFFGFFTDEIDDLVIVAILIFLVMRYEYGMKPPNRDVPVALYRTRPLPV